jgi:hypothetical protein
MCRGRGTSAPARRSCERRFGRGWRLFVTWLNHEYVWDVADVIPPCWPQHSHLVHETLFSPISATAPVKRSPVRRWRSGIDKACPSSPNGCGRDCGTTVKKIISRGRPRAATPRHIAEASCRRRGDSYAADVRAVKPEPDHTQSPRHGLVDLDTGEIKQL